MKKKVLLVVSVVLIITLLLPVYVKYKARHKIFAKVENVSEAEFAIVLGAAIKKNKQPGNFLKARLDDAVTLFKSGKVKKILVSGDNGLMAHDEISSMNNYLVANGVPQSKIFGDYAGFDTYSTMERANKIFGIEDAIVVSQGFHLPRSLYIAQKKGIEAQGFATKQSLGKRKYFIREYFATIKSVLDCLMERKSKFYGKKVDTNSGSNIKIDQLN